MRLRDRVVLVTGAGRGIGRGLALALGEEGADVALTYHQSARGAEEVTAALRGMGRRALAIPANLAHAVDARRCVTATVAAFGRLDVLVYNAGITDPRPFLEITEAQYDATLNTNLKGAFFCAQEAARTMIRQGIAGRIIVISSLHAVLSFPAHAHYAASKAGLDQFARTIANELGPYGIRVNAVQPGMIEVEKYPDVIAGYEPAAWGPTVPLGRVGHPSDVAAAVLFLASSDADYVTGAVIRVDGGIMTRSPHYPPSSTTTYPDRRPAGGAA
jgi:NAD(P)-dependent dehydrogenase (short-subunit alcohol dehydrogenase family)